MADRPKPSLKRALRIIHESNPRTPGAFGKIMWEGNPAWSNRPAKGTGRGQGMFLASGGYLAKLRKHGFIKPAPKYTAQKKVMHAGWLLTKKGLSVLYAE